MRAWIQRRLLSRVISMVAVATLALSGSLLAQGVTTAAITGTVTDSATGAPIAGAHVVAVHGPSGSSYVASTRDDGRFTIPGMRVGGPYRVTVAQIGYQRRAQAGIYLTLGVSADVRFYLLPVSVELEAISVTGQADAVFSSGRTGAATAVPQTQISQLPTISRRVEDMLRLTPQYSPNNLGFSFAGQNNLLNNMTIDGSYFNNSFGLAGQPGDRTGVSAVSLDALSQVEVNVAPYDVRQGNFVGAGINMVTKSGTNDFSGSLYYNFRNNKYVGTQAGPNTFNPGTFKFSDIGFNLGGPIIRNRLFFFVSGENDVQTAPGTTFLANTGGQTVGGAITRVNASTLDSLSNFLQSKFNYNPGVYQGYNFNTPAGRFLARLDFNLNDKNKLTLRYNVLNSSTDVLVSNSNSLGFGSRRGTTSSLTFSNSNYGIMEDIRSTVAEWNSTISSTMANNLIVGYTSNNENRTKISEPWFPEVEILQTGQPFTTFGFEPFTPANQLTYHSTQFQDNFTIYLPKNSVTFGVSVESYHSNNVFFPGAQSVYVYNSLADFYTSANCYLTPTSCAGQPTLKEFQYRYSNIPGQTQPVQPLDVTYAGVYAQDEWRPTQNLTVTAGLRVDAPKFGNTGYDNAVADTMKFLDASGATVQYNSGKLPPVNPLFSPRLGFNYDLQGKHTTQIRGGTGVFSGRPAYVWISNQIGNTGVLTGFIQAQNTTAYGFNPSNTAYAPPASAITGGPASSFELALTAPKFKFPQVWRSNFGVDQRLPWGLTGTAEFLYTKDVNGISYENVNLPAAQTKFTGADNRPRWTSNRIYSAVSDATVLTNEGVGSAYNLSFSVEKPATSGLYFKLGYTYGVSKNITDPGSIAFGSWTGIASGAYPNNPGVGYSANSPGSRFFAAVSYTRDFFGIGATTAGVYFSGNTNGNGSYVFSGDMNGDGVSNNDLIYIAKDTSQMNFVPEVVGTTTYTRQQQQAAWEAYIEQDKYLSSHRGQVAERNGVFLPMVWRADVSASQSIGGRMFGAANALQIRLDILNFTNLLNKNWGVSQSFVTTRPLIASGVDASGASQYKLATVGTALLPPASFTKVVSTNDVWRMQLGVRYMLNQ